MGAYINTGNAGFQQARNSVYVDKSEIISVVNQTLFTEFQFSCVSRCRRFGKSMILTRRNIAVELNIRLNTLFI